MKIAFVSSEILPFAKTGGLADVSGVLPRVLAQSGIEVTAFIPLYSQINKAKHNIRKIENIEPITLLYESEKFLIDLYTAKIPDSNVDTVFIDCPELYDRPTLYTLEPDEGKRFGLFNRAVMEAIIKLDLSLDIIHCNDWQTGLIPYLLKENYAGESVFKNTSSVFTIHNIAYQGIFSIDLIRGLSLNESYNYPMGPLEYFGKINFLKAGLVFADVITTVSETYSKEILTEEFGAGMEGILKERKNRLHGILNGVDYNEWDPSKDKLIAKTFSVKNLSGKHENKIKLLEKAGFHNSENIPLIGIVSRMVEQKGTEIFIEIVDELMKHEMRFVVLGSGTKEYEQMYLSISKKYPDKFYIEFGYDNQLAHLIEAGSDIFLMPSRYEPCGLNQIYSLKYGTVPIVRFTGGLADTVHDSELLGENGDTWTGFIFREFSGSALLETILRAIDTYNDKTLWEKIMINGMEKDYSWERSAQKYIDIYKKLT